MTRPHMNTSKKSAHQINSTHAPNRDEHITARQEPTPQDQTFTSTVTITSILTLISTIRGIRPRFLEHPQSKDVVAWARRDGVSESTVCHEPSTTTLTLTDTITHAAMLGAGVADAMLRGGSMSGFVWPTAGVNATQRTASMSGFMWPTHRANGTGNASAAAGALVLRSVDGHDVHHWSPIVPQAHTKYIMIEDNRLTEWTLRDAAATAAAETGAGECE
ncbi:hypothetical protein CC86DRAFT_56454 [Ophiobolus disseminans]|uniref:Uncharacterized protein n=1 Tax=Ophiobolus disseminans TaxID=1469910 RepID=A0A6A6ZTX3_9PLEO|nr:hypothetical protein CC86DRAFT_56454 [Ophiobolus disseminans]